ncbi:hypothetical protein ScPMuIL_001897 [Solemya velum]
MREILLSDVLGSHFKPYYYKPHKLDDCDDRLRRRLNRIVEVNPKPDISGIWTSSKCEIRPGPEFLLRKYIFSNDSSFEIHQYYYADTDCTQPMYVVIASGSYKFIGESWTTLGGTDAKYYLHRVDIIPYNSISSSLLGETAKSKCPTLNLLSWKRYQRHSILQLMPPSKTWRQGYDFDCMKYFNLSFHELQLIRKEVHHHQNKEATNRSIEPKVKTVMELYFGDIHTVTAERQFYRPTGYQTPLQHEHTDGCRVCSMVANSNIFHPARLHRRHPPQLNLDGHWVSSRCETRPHGQFLTRRLTFLPDGRSWQGQYDFYSDPFCRNPTFSISAKGRHVLENDSPVIPGALDYNLRLLRLKITPKDHKTVEIMNFYQGNKCGIPKTWKIGVTQDVTSTSGCATLGIELPKAEFQLLKLDKEHHKELLFIGHRPTEGNDMSARDKRPTSFQEPLIKCKLQTTRLAVVSNAIFERQFRPESLPENSASGHHRICMMMLFQVILSILTSCRAVV